MPLDGSSPLLPPDQAARLRRGAQLEGTIQSEGTRYLYAARLVGGKGFMLLQPASSTNSAWRPQLQGLIVAAIATSALAALIAFLLARAIARPVRRVAEATRGLASSTERPPLVPVEGPRELAQLAESFNDLADRSDEGAGSRASFPALRQPRAEDAADRNPWLRRGPAGGSAASRGSGHDDRRPSRAGWSGSSATCSTSRG